MMQSVRLFACLAAGLMPVSVATAGDGNRFWSGDWSLTVGGSLAHGPAFEGAKDRKFLFSPVISLGRQGQAPRFSSRNDSAGLTLYENDFIRTGLAGKLITGRNEDTSTDLKGLSEVKFGAEVGGFIDVYPIDNVRARAELRHGIRSHTGTVADLSVDAFTDITPQVRISGGPRATYATSEVGRAYYGVDASEALASGLALYAPASGWQSVGVGGAVTWKATENIETSAFIEYKRMVGVAANSSLVRQKGSPDQLLIGVSATYRFDFSLD
ncbi:MipA/OmpV family protein [Ciceribacter sp. RN22]|uniref:MipA/OmpV family protein n=1 Tax=Ciceribacter sp. RN22 TaxID=2954932 RepID=UPI00209334DB|nr:MipA/OmpV family protein [Ciceribacter sp. RN22]MCO6180913.1 MipA/OmpV family protein [Ciceribacter sp. RN22]